MRMLDDNPIGDGAATLDHVKFAGILEAQSASKLQAALVPALNNGPEHLVEMSLG